MGENVGVGPKSGGVRPELALAIPLTFTLLLVALALLVPAIRNSSTLLWSFLGAAGVLLAWNAGMFVSARRRGRMLTVEVVLRPQHYLQACAHLSILTYWGWYWREVYDAAPLIAGQLCFAYAFDALLAWSRRDVYTLGFGPFPIIFSTNLFLWFKRDWFYLQFLMVGVGFAAKELIRWNKDGRHTHIFNPSSFTLTLFSVLLLLTGATAITWGQEISITQFNPPHIYLLIFMVSLPAQFLFGTAAMTLSAVATTFALGALYFVVTGTHFWNGSGGFFPEPIPIAVFLAMHLLFTDPSTAPRTELGRIFFGMLYGSSVMVIFVILLALNLPGFYDKLLPVPILNLMIQAIDRVVRSNPLRRFDPGAFGRGLMPRQRNMAYMSVWILFFVGMQVSIGAHATLMRGDTLLDQGRIEEAIVRYREFVQDDPADPDGHQRLGRGLMQAGQTEAAIASLQRAIELQPDHAAAHENLGQALLQVERAEDAVRSLQRAIELQPNSPNAHINLGAALTQAGRAGDAVMSLQRAIEVQPDNPTAHHNLGVALMQAGRPHDAVVSLQRAIELRPDGAEAHDNLGRALIQAGRAEDAVTALQRAVELRPDNPTAYNDLGVALMRTGRLQEAVVSLQRATALEPDSPTAHDNLGQALTQAGRVDEAVPALQRAVALQPNNPSAYTNLGVALMSRGRLQEAVVSLQRAVELEPGSAEAHDNLGRVLLQAGRARDAVASCRRAVELKPDFPEARYNLARALDTLGERTAAIAQLREALRLRPEWPLAVAALAGLGANR